MFKQILKINIQYCDEIKEFLENILTNDNTYECIKYLNLSLIYSEKIKEFIYDNFEFFDKLHYIDGLIDDLQLFKNESDISNIKAVSRPCLSQLKGVKSELIKSELLYNELKNFK